MPSALYSLLPRKLKVRHADFVTYDRDLAGSFATASVCSVTAVLQPPDFADLCNRLNRAPKLVYFASQ